MYLMEHTCFKAQLCIKVSFFNGVSNVDILINLCLGASLIFGQCGIPLMLHTMTWCPLWGPSVSRFCLTVKAK